METHRNKTIGIIGGMGPLATMDLFRKIVELTDSENDQGHPRVLIDSNTNTPDRTPAILCGGADPLPEMVRAALLLERGGADVLVMGCNTAHFFYPKMGLSSVGLLATDGTVQSGVYAREFERQGIDLVTPDAAGQKAVVTMIYQGVKTGRASWPVEEISRVIGDLAARGARAVVLGCTELPVAFSRYRIQSGLPVLDPTEVLAESAIRFVGGRLRRK